MPFSRYKFAKTSKCTEWSQNDLENLSARNTLYTLFLSFALRKPFSRPKLAEKFQMHWMIPEWPWAHNCQNVSACTKYLPHDIRPKPFFEIHCTMLLKIEMHRMTWHWTWKSKVLCIHKMLTLEAQIFVSLILRQIIFEIQDCRKTKPNKCN